MKLVFRDGVEDDISGIKNAVVRKNSIGWIERLVKGTAGKAIKCGWQQSTGDLNDCYKFYFDEHDDPRKKGLPTKRRSRYYRIVYRILNEGETLEVVAVGPGHPPPGTEAAYVTAGARLGRIPAMQRSTHQKRFGLKFSTAPALGLALFTVALSLFPLRS